MKHYKRLLRKLEFQAKYYTEKDYLKEAEKLEKEMIAQNIKIEVPADFIQQTIAKAKLIECQKSRTKIDTAQQNVRPDLQ